MNAKDIRQYLLMAADKIERSPTQFVFSSTDIPGSGGGCGCALGWIGYFAGLRNAINADAVELLTGNRDTALFYQRMSELGNGWHWDAAVCSRNMRCYADTYFPNNSNDDHGPSDADVEASIARHTLGVTP